MTYRAAHKNKNKKTPSGAPLGIYAKSSPPPLKGADYVRAKRAERYTMQGVARSVLATEGKTVGLAQPYSYHRTCTCKIANVSDDVGISKSSETKGAYFTGLATCGSVWTCPVCATPIQERRRAEITSIMDAVYKTNHLKCAMITLTFPHQRTDDLGDLLDKQASALKYLRSSSPWTKLAKSIGYAGLVRSLELTHSEENGWHPHTHELWIINRDADTDALLDKLIERWKKCCIKAGLLDADKLEGEGYDLAYDLNFETYSVDIRDNARSSEYFAKMDDSKNWGIDRELAKASSKKGKRSGRHPFQLLDDFRIDNDARSAQLFVQYSDVMRAKRKRQIYISPAIRKMAELVEQPDEEVADEASNIEDETLFQVYPFSIIEWRQAVKKQLRSKLLDAAETGGTMAVIRLLQDNDIVRPNGSPDINLLLESAKPQKRYERPKRNQMVQHFIDTVPIAEYIPLEPVSKPLPEI